MPRGVEVETTSLKWIHHIREQQFRKAKGLPVEAQHARSASLGRRACYLSSSISYWTEY